MIDLLLIGAYLGSRQVGLFGAPLRLLTLLTYPGLAVASGVAPRLARAQGQEPDAGALAGGLRGLIMFQSLLLAPMIVWARPIVEIPLGGGYSGSIATVQVLSISVYLGGFAPLVSLSANYLGDAKSRIPLMIAAAAIDGAIDVVLIPRIGIVSGAIATAVAFAVMDIGHLVICRRHVELPFARLGISAGRGLIAAGAMAGVMALIGTNPSVPVLILGAVPAVGAFVLVLIVLGEISGRELAQVRRWAGARVSALRP
jgi:O-antigen/teichoic acid export membrane protein